MHSIYMPNLWEQSLVWLRSYSDTDHWTSQLPTSFSLRFPCWIPVQVSPTLALPADPHPRKTVPAALSLIPSVFFCYCCLQIPG